MNRELLERIAMALMKGGFHERVSDMKFIIKASVIFDLGNVFAVLCRVSSRVEDVKCC